MDSSPRGFPFGANNSNLLTFSGPPGLPTPLSSLSLFGGNGSDTALPFGDTSPLRSILGPSTGLMPFTPHAAGTQGLSVQLAADRFTGTMYVANSPSIAIFNRASTASGDVAPDRILNLSARGIAVDRTR